MRSSKNPSVVRHGHRSDLRDLPVAELMASPPVAVDAACSLSFALRTFAVYGIRHLVVLDDAGRAIGMLTDRAVAARWASHPATFEKTPVAQLISDDQPVVDRSASLASAARAMRRCGTDAVVVTDGQRRPAGVLTSSDLIGIIAKPHLR